ncbi:tetratricopeptide repeat protein [Fluviicola sp.]|uniref:tetratricopeptide repeat protein n=1 Tax=Fluviicola sp. TaxID=1917219 RepID=UPI0031D67FFC
MGSGAFGQTEYLDSLKNALQKPVSSDTMRVFQYNEIAWTYLDYSLDSTYVFANKALNLARKRNYPNGIMDAKNTLGIYYRYLSQYSKAITMYNELIALRIKNHQEDKLTGAYANLGSVYYEKGAYAQALKHYQKAIDIAKKFHQDDKILVLYTNLAAAYKSVGLYDQAISTFQEGLKLNKRIKNKEQEAQLYMNLSTVYHDRNMIDESVKYSEIARKLSREVNAVRNRQTILYNLSLDYRTKKQFSKAKACLDEMYSVAKEMDEEDIWLEYYLARANYLYDLKRFDEAMKFTLTAGKYANREADLLNYGEVELTKASIYAELKQYKEGIESAELALDAFRDTEDAGAQIRTLKVLAELYKRSGSHEKALKVFEEAQELKEKTDLESVTNQIATLNSLNELERKEQDLALSRQTNEKIEAENQRKSNLILGLFLIGGLIVISLGISFRSNQEKKKANALLNKQNEEIEDQKSLIEQKQTEILDSIHYAKRIQESLLVQQTLLKEALPESFIFFQPKDIVSGDFYWATKRDDQFYLAICDSTGHGVPGAFMSALNITFLSEAINQLGITEPGKIFDHVRKRLVESISHDGARDGMDGVLFCFDESNRKLSYAAAYNNPVLVRGGELIKFPADKMPVGKSDLMTEFQTYMIDLEPGDELFAYTDGYADQFGGEKGKKLKLANLHAYLLRISTEKAPEQHDLLKNHFQSWKGNLDQVDDVCLFGVKL